MRYNALVIRIKLGKISFSKDSWFGRHHIIPKSERPDLEKDERNIVVLPIEKEIGFLIAGI